jgi:hypothetical protein
VSTSSTPIAFAVASIRGWWRAEGQRLYPNARTLIATTTTAKGLNVTCRLDRRRYPVGRKVSKDEIATVNLTPHAFHGEWNYLIRPRANM